MRIMCDSIDGWGELVDSPCDGPCLKQTYCVLWMCLSSILCLYGASQTCCNIEAARMFSICIICTSIRICGLGGAGNYASQQGIWLPLVGWCELYACTQQQQLRGRVGDDHDYRSPPNASCLVALVATHVEVLCLSSLWNGQSGCHLFLP